MKDLDLIYFAARELPPEARPAYLDAVCGGDQALRKRVEQMLNVSRDAEAFITDLPGDGGDRSPSREPADSPDEEVGGTIGRYKLLERVGEGGCGVVYVAKQMEPVRRRVALKVIKLGMDTRQVVARFEAERQALAMMDHPNIAKVLDAGTTDAGGGGLESSNLRSQIPKGRPYFVMELVRGVRITDYCEQTGLSTRERIDLFVKVCHAIQHAHQKGIIHRDIKPSNILVTLHDGVPVPKVIDFGIAKATEGRLSDDTVYTQLHHFIGTPAYMSPEQAEMSGLDIDTRSDIYSLGVLLYELLVGTTPFDGKELLASGLDAMRKTIREKEPLRPSTKLSQTLMADARRLKASTASGDASDSREQAGASSRRLVREKETVSLLKGDLDWIVMKCLEKDRSRRYETANGLAADLNRHLANEPVVACPPSAMYRFRKSFRRNRVVFLAGIAVAIALLLGIVGSTWQAVEATSARMVAVTQQIAAQESEAKATALQLKAEAERRRAEEHLRRAEWLAYAGKLTIAQNDFEAGNGGLAAHYLEECQPNLRGWEHRYLRTRISARLTLEGHKAEVYGLAYSPDGRRIASVSPDKTVRIWDAATGQELTVLQGHTHWVTSVAFSPDGQRIVTGAGLWANPGKMPSEAKVWDARTGEEMLALATHAGCVRSVAFSPDGSRIVTASGDAYLPGEANVWDAQTGQELLSLKAREIYSVAFSPDGRRILAGSMDRTAKVWDATTGEELLVLKGHSRGLRAVAFSPDGRHIVTASMDTTAKIWDAATGRELHVLKGHLDDVSSVAFSRNGQRIVTGSWDQTAKVWDAATGAEVFALKGHSGAVRSVAFSPDGGNIVTGSTDRKAKIWDAATGQDIPTLRGHGDFVSSIAFSPDGRRIVTGSGDGTAKVWDATGSRELLELRPSTSRVWNVVALWSVAFSPDGRSILTGGQDRTARLWDAGTGEQLLLLQHDDVVKGVAFSPDGKRLLTGGSEKSARIWDAVTGRELLSCELSSAVNCVAFSPDGKSIIVGHGNQAAIWDAASGRQIFLFRGHAAPVQSVAFSPDGQCVITSSADRTAKIWSTTTGSENLTLKGHTDIVRGAVFSADGQRIVTGSDDRTAKIWESGSGQELLALRGHEKGVYSVAFSPDGQRIVTGTGGANATAKVWSAVPR